MNVISLAHRFAWLQSTDCPDIKKDAFGTLTKQAYLYRGVHSSICPPALTMNMCPLDMFLCVFTSPRSLLHLDSTLSHSSVIAFIAAPSYVALPEEIEKSIYVCNIVPCQTQVYKKTCFFVQKLM